MFVPLASKEVRKHVHANLLDEMPVIIGKLNFLAISLQALSDNGVGCQDEDELNDELNGVHDILATCANELNLLFEVYKEEHAGGADHEN